MTEIMSAVITLLSGLVTAFLVPYLKAKLTEKQQNIIMTLIEIAVNSAEQLFKNQEKSGYHKMMYVKTFLANNGIDTDSEKVMNMIESAVYALQGGKA